MHRRQWPARRHPVRRQRGPTTRLVSSSVQIPQRGQPLWAKEEALRCRKFFRIECGLVHIIDGWGPEGSSFPCATCCGSTDKELIVAVLDADFLTAHSLHPADFLRLYVVIAPTKLCVAVCISRHRSEVPPTAHIATAVFPICLLLQFTLPLGTA